MRRGVWRTGGVGVQAQVLAEEGVRWAGRVPQGSLGRGWGRDGAPDPRITCFPPQAPAVYPTPCDPALTSRA